MIVGLTGGIGSGKSTVAKMFSALGVPIYDSDKEAKHLMNSDRELMQSIRSLFGEAAYDKKTLNRTFIASQVFKDRNLLKRLNKIVHPAVRNHFMDWASQQNYFYVMQETALIFENKMEANYEKIILVTSPIETRINRVVKRDDVARDAVISRIENQLPDSEKIVKSDFVINNIELDKTKLVVNEIHEKLLSEVR